MKVSFDRMEMLQTFVRIVESGSLSAAAAQLQTTQPTVSRRLQALEQTLGSKLILRTTHAMKLTDDGERCLAHARQVIGHWQSLEDELRGATDDPVGTLRVRAPHAFGQDQLIVPVTAFLKAYPNLAVEWQLNDRTPDFIADAIDCAIQVGPITDPSMVAVLIAEIPRIVVAAPSLLAGQPIPTKVDALVALPWVALNMYYRHEVQLTCTRSHIQQRFAINTRLSTDSLYAVRKAAIEGLGAAIVSSWIVAEDLAQGTLLHLCPTWQAEALPVYLTYPYASYYPARLRRFLDLIRRELPRITGVRAPHGER